MDDSQYSGGDGIQMSMNGTVVTDGVRELLVPDELHGRIEEPTKNTLEEYQVFNKLKRTKYFEARPDTVHFSGFVLGHRHQKVVKIVNVSHLTKRIHVMPCQTPYFTVHFDKKGKIAPGMSEELVVEFVPHEWRYYYDCIRIHLEDQNLLVPIHGYPTVAPRQGATIDGSSLVLPSADSDTNGVYFPSKIDFGFCHLSERVERAIPIQNPVPVEFEYEITVVVKHPDIEIEPLRGTVPAHSKALVNMSYTPSKMATAECHLDINISQFGFKTQRVVVMGSAMAGATREALVKSLTQHLRQTGQLASEQSLENYSAVRMPGDGRINLTVVHDEAKGFKDKVEAARMARRPGEPIHIRRAQPPEPDHGNEIKGVMIPADLRPRASTQKVLNQVTGKLTWKELKRQMEETGELGHQEEKLDPKAKANASINWYETKRMQPGGFLDIEEEYGEGGRLQVIEFRYETEVRMREDYDKAKDVKYFPAIGDDPTTEEEREMVTERREHRRRMRDQQEREILRQQKGTIADEKLKVAHEVGRLPAVEPTLDPYLNDAWTVRKEITAHFRAQMHKIIIRNRVSRRVEMIRHKLEQGGLTGGASSSLVETILAADSAPQSSAGGSRDKMQGKMANMTVDRVVSSTFPVYRDGNFRDRDKVPVIDIEPIRDWDFLDLKVPCTYKLMGYGKEAIAPVPTYVSLEEGREFRRGAAVEEGIRGARGHQQPDAKPPAPADGAPAPAADAEDKKPKVADMKMPNMFKITPEGLCHPKQAGKSTLFSFDSPRGDTAAAAPDNPVGTGGRSICRALDSENRAQEGRAQGKCLVYAPLLPHVETDLDFALRVFPRVVGDGELDGSLSGPAGFLGRALNPSARGQPLNAAIFGYVSRF
jgi:hypothetical protein